MYVGTGMVVGEKDCGWEERQSDVLVWLVGTKLRAWSLYAPFHFFISQCFLYRDLHNMHALIYSGYSAL